MAPLTRHAASSLATGGLGASTSSGQSQESWDLASSESRSDADDFDDSLLLDDENSVLQGDTSGMRYHRGGLPC